MPSKSVQKDVQELHDQLLQGSIQSAYRALITYMSGLRHHFGRLYGDAAISGLYQGFMDMTYFAVFPSILNDRNLKVAIVFNYDTFRFEAWLAARNRNVQRQYYELFRDYAWPDYRIIKPAAGIDSIIECDLLTEFDLDTPETMTANIERNMVRFIEDIEKALSLLDNR